MFFPLQHRGSSLTMSVRSRAEKDPENTRGQAVLDKGHRLPEAGLPALARVQYHTQTEPMLLGSSWLGPEGHRVTL